MPTIKVYAGLGPILHVYEGGSIAGVAFSPDPAAVSVIPDPAIPFDILGPAGLLLAAAGRRQSEASK